MAISSPRSFPHSTVLVHCIHWTPCAHHMSMQVLHLPSSPGYLCLVYASSMPRLLNPYSSHSHSSLSIRVNLPHHGRRVPLYILASLVLHHFFISQPSTHESSTCQAQSHLQLQDLVCQPLQSLCARGWSRRWRIRWYHSCCRSGHHCKSQGAAVAVACRGAAAAHEAVAHHCRCQG